ncbi:MAG: hypothetical protein JKY65_21215, partial [Planctomycetes bacterium]|nr:hypothetical protein [Planctomycetota bacterium]
MLLLSDQGDQGSGWTDEEVAEGLGSSRHSVRSIRLRYAQRGTQGAINRKKGKCTIRRTRKLDGGAGNGNSVLGSAFLPRQKPLPGSRTGTPFSRARGP